MYHVLVNNQTLYYPVNTDYTIYETELKMDVGLAGEFKFKVPSDNPNYSLVGQGAIITILRDNVEYWRGEVKETSVDINKVMSVYCLEDLAWLSDEFLFPSLIDDETYAQRFSTAIGAYNTDRGSDRQFTVGYLTNVNSSSICNWATEYEWSILDCLRNCIAGDTGYIRVRRSTVGGVVTRYIDCVRLTDYGTAATQPIRFGINLLDYLEEMKLDNFVNDLYPYGSETDTEIYNEYNQRLAGTHIQDATSIGAYGKHSKAVVFETDDLTTLNSLASAYLTRYSQPQLTLKIDAIDLAEISTDAHFEIGDSITVIAEPFAIDQNMYLTEQSIDLQDVSKNKVTLSSYVTRGNTITGQNNEAAEAIQKIPSKSSILDAAKNNAYAILTGENGGYVTFDKNSDDQIIELRIANNLDIDKATKCWRWNLNGLAYLHRTVYTDPWTVGIAATMDGAIVADFITSGTLQSITISGNTISGNSISGNTISGNTISGNTISGGTISGSQLIGATGTLTDGTGTLSLSGGDLHMINANDGGPGVFMTKDGSPYYSCWGAVNSSARDSYSPGGYIDCSTKNVIQAGIDASDIRLKKDVNDITSEFAKSLIMGVHPKTFHYVENKNLPAELQFGVIAQDVLAIEEEFGITEKNRLCYEQADGMLAVNYKQLIAPMIKVIQDQQKQIDELKKSMKGERNG